MNWVGWLGLAIGFGALILSIIALVHSNEANKISNAANEISKQANSIAQQALDYESRFKIEVSTRFVVTIYKPGRFFEAVQITVRNHGKRTLYIESAEIRDISRKLRVGHLRFDPPVNFPISLKDSESVEVVQPKRDLAKLFSEDFNKEVTLEAAFRDKLGNEYTSERFQLNIEEELAKPTFVEMPLRITGPIETDIDY
ncbi:MAG: hypothetical protein SWK76_00185 [Actinomycetota bacterium]|nr:hypothetical protein [Actinomycetota bacterium]